MHGMLTNFIGAGVVSLLIMVRFLHPKLSEKALQKKQTQHSH